MSDLTTKAMLIKLSISQWTARKHDKRADSTVEHTFGATDAGRYNKSLIAREAVKKVEKTANSARTWHYDNTLPWSDDGYRVLPAKNFLTYSEKIRELKADFEASVSEFIDSYPDLVADAKVRLNGLFNAADYPGSDTIGKRFNIDSQISPLPSGTDFRVSLNSEETAKIQGEIETRTKASLEEAHKDLYRRLADAISHMADRLSDGKAIFRDSLIENIRELVELLPRLDLVGDSQLDAIRRQAEEKLCKYSPQTLRENEAVRSETAKDAKAILDAMAGMYQ